jgi:hypothetical protein
VVSLDNLKGVERLNQSCVLRYLEILRVDAANIKAWVRA